VREEAASSEPITAPIVFFNFITNVPYLLMVSKLPDEHKTTQPEILSESTVS
jgi:hypothetical protein